MSREKSYMIAVIVDNRPGVLYGVSNMFRRRNFNIDSITVGAINSDLARMTITVRGDERTIEQIVKHLRKLVDVLKVAILDEANTVSRELALVKIFIPDSKARADVLHYVDIFRGHVVDVSSETLTVEITGDPDKIDAFINLMQNFGVKEVARTGIVALSRGPKSIVIEGLEEER